MAKRYLVLTFSLLLLGGGMSSSDAQDGSLGFSSLWTDAPVGWGDIGSGPVFNQFRGGDTLASFMDFRTTLSHPLDPDDFFDRFFHPAVTEDQEENSLLSPFRVSETEKEMAFKADLLPGTGLGDVAISSDGEALTVQVERTEMDETSGDDYSRVEWSRETFTRVAPLPGEVQPTEPGISYEDGVLTLTFPKK